MLFHKKPCVCDPLWELSTGNITVQTWLEKWLAPPGFIRTGLEPWRQKVSPVFFKTTSKWQYPFTRTQMESYSKNYSVVETSQRGTCEQLPLLSAGLRAQFFFFSLKRTMIISELRGSPGCGRLPSAASYREREFPQHLWKLQRTSKTLWPDISSTSGDRKSTNNWTGLGTWTSGDESCCVTSVTKTLEGWDWSWQKWVSRGPKWLP